MREEGRNRNFMFPFLGFFTKRAWKLLYARLCNDILTNIAQFALESLRTICFQTFLHRCYHYAECKSHVHLSRYYSELLRFLALQIALLIRLNQG